MDSRYETPSPAFSSPLSRPTRILIDQAYLKQAIPQAQNLVDTFLAKLEVALNLKVAHLNLDNVFDRKYGSGKRLAKIDSEARDGNRW